ncbi:MAG: thymidylate synthase, partial [Candidatus Competibacterales bacterium]
MSPRHPEYQYLDLLAAVSTTGDRREDRTGVGTLALFGATARFDITDGQVPVLTTKRVAWRTAIREMLWFLTGQTNIRPLLLQDVHIWTAWPLATYRRTTGEDMAPEDFERRILEDPTFAARWGDLGPVYGKQWRRWQGPDGRQHDQIQTLLHTLKTAPSSRRMLFHAWNVAELEAMALPPCHLLYQFHVTSDGRLHCLLYMRSCDLFLGTPFNWVGAVALQLMVAQQTGLKPGTFIWMGGDVHLYLNHLEVVRRQLTRTPRPWPRLGLRRVPATIDDYTIDDFVLEDYDP